MGGIHGRVPQRLKILFLNVILGVFDERFDIVHMSSEHSIHKYNNIYNYIYIYLGVTY